MRSTVLDVIRMALPPRNSADVLHFFPPLADMPAEPKPWQEFRDNSFAAMDARAWPVHYMACHVSLGVVPSRNHVTRWCFGTHCCRYLHGTCPQQFVGWNGWTMY